MTDPHAQTGPAHGPHVLSPRTLLGTTGVLLGLTAVTVLVSRIHLGEANVVVALAIAALKATLVALFFMHLKYEHRFLRVVLIASVVFAVLLVAFVLFDTTQYQGSVREHEARARTR